MTAPRTSLRVAAMADLHVPHTPPATLQPAFAHAAANADVLLLCGDLTDHGLADEARLLAKELTAAVKIPVIAVLGNHDFESGRPQDVSGALVEAGVTVLDGEGCEVHGVGFAGVKGFGGGFGQRALQPWGEEIIKRFVREAVDEALKLESALARLRTPQRVAVLHYAPIPGTVQDEAPEIMAFLGSSRLEEPLTRYAVTRVFHGHAHGGRLEGRTLSDIPVYNVALPVLRRTFPNRPPVHVVDIPIDVAAAA